MGKCYDNPEHDKPHISVQNTWKTEREVFKQETLEEVAANLADPTICKTNNWIAGAKYMAEKMYSEEEVLELLLNCRGENPINIEQWFEQNKKK